MSNRVVFDYDEADEGDLLYKNFHLPYWATSMSRAQAVQLAKGMPVKMGGKFYAVCGDCRKLVRLDKPLVGSAHLCRSGTSSAMAGRGIMAPMKARPHPGEDA